MKTLLFLILSCLPMLGATCSTTGTAAFNWDTPARWDCGHTPIDGIDTAVINTAVVVTIPACSTVTVGTYVTNAVLINNNAAELIVSGTLNAKGHVVMNSTTSKLTMQTAGACNPTINLMSTAGLTSVLSNGGSGQQTFTIAGTSAYPAIITTTPGTGLPGYISIPAAGATGGPWFVWNNVEIGGLGSAAQTALVNIRSIQGSNIYIRDSGQFTTSGSGYNHFDIDGLTIRNPLNTTTFGSISMAAPISGQVRQIKRLNLAGTANHGFQLSGPNIVLEDVVIYNSFLQSVYLSASNTGANHTYRRILWIGQNGNNNADSHALKIPSNGGFTLEDFGMFHRTATNLANDNVGHQIKFSGQSPATGPTTIRRGVFECAGDHTGGGWRSGGDLILSAGTVNMNHLLAVNGCGNVYDGLISPTIQNAKNFTLVDLSPNNNGGQGGFVISEGSPGTDANQGYLRNNLIVGAISGIAQGGNFVRQSAAFDLRNNASYDLRSGGSGYGYFRHPAKPAVETYFERPTAANTLITLSTPQAGSTSTSYIASGTGLGVMRGDYLKMAVWAVITNVQDNVPTTGKTTFTLGVNIQGTTGITLSGAETVYRGWWNDGVLYGEGTRGAGDLLGVNPYLVDRSADVAKYDALCGGPGTMDHFSDEAIKRYSNRDKSGSSAVWNSCYSLEGIVAYLRQAYTPRNPQLKSAGYSADGSPDIGAVPVSLTFGALSGAVIQ